MPTSSVVDSGALIALFEPRDQHHAWAVSTFARLPAPWLTCEAALTESYFQLFPARAKRLTSLLRKGTIRIAFDLDRELIPVLDLREKYADVPMSIADACLVRMTEILPDPLVLTTDADFRIYRRHGRRVVPVLMP